VGLELGFLQGGDHPLGVEGGSWLSSEGGGFSRKGVVCLGLLSSPRLQLQTTKEKRFANHRTPERNLQQILSLHLVGLQGRKRIKERKTRVGVLMAEFNF
jgi:hypothetical protein